ncbi:MAG TPA: hypothetical protein VEC99_18375 [Clostridia bacterium]|nr:hypothetical protein [Clostridia bacterium]
MEDWHKGTGRIVYDPPRPGLKRKRDWWVVVELDQGITDYYRWWVNRMLLNPLGFERKGLQMPSWGPHMSIIRGEKPWPDKMHLWKKYDGQQVEFHYDYKVRQSGDTTGADRPDNYWFVDAVCPLGTQMREEFGYKSDWKFHITVGRTY